ncbi:MAG: rRNA methyltransferase [Chromatiaceae bacterium]|nr:rRNA methyltransferase [Gammaproteobacteria bacterium]MCP5299974.1 rRNA methyltransferase [Chromatiaceae bacterium]MCP5422046.1 rRNA methyltransferase [Chromatiaceae bacterium]
MNHQPLTRTAHEAVAAALTPGALAIDATVGNGNDTLFLANAVTPGGHVCGFDIQPAALDATRARLVAAGLVDAVTLHPVGHEHMAARIPPDWRGRVAAIMFNLGYLPGGDKALITRAETTVAALDQGLDLLRPGGLISLLQYRGHAGAMSEVDAVDEWVEGASGHCRITRCTSPGPILNLIRAGR